MTTTNYSLRKTMKPIDPQGNPYGTANYHGIGPDYNHWLSDCCGARFVAKPKPTINLRRPHVGIRIVNGIVNDECDDPVYFVKHLQTKAGPLTVGIRRKVNV